MQQETLHATKRVTSGSRASNRLRRDGRIPGVVYGSAIDPQPVHVASRDLYAVLHTEAGLNAIIELDVEGSPILTVAREVQRHPVRGDISHLDFIEVRMDTEIHAEVAVEYLGVPVGVRDDGGIVETLEASVMISALPGQIPSSIQVEIGELGVGDTLKVADLPAVEGVTYLADGEHPLMTVVIPAAIIEPVELEAEEEGEGLEGEEPSEGETSEDSVEDED
jgi:large subunit ribosomal protein L25